ncbi:dual specificity protein kinase yak1 [Linnemannia hyalina]|uniref:Dual specificity protein kinase yak1 n=1 Tax=Linnemannia hyalina TaxID=64524 RepID=A0A9P7XNC6_9FUNG|nr:dual specificity protein kinase yak1 [Linnemannia hyalina]
MDPYLQQQQTDQQQQHVHHTPRYRHVSAPVNNQPQNLSSFQESMRQDSVVVNTSSAVDMRGALPPTGSEDEPHLYGYDYSSHGYGQDNSNSNYNDQESSRSQGAHSSESNHRSHQGTPFDREREIEKSTGHVGITIDHQQGHDLDQHQHQDQDYTSQQPHHQVGRGAHGHGQHNNNQGQSQSQNQSQPHGQSHGFPQGYAFGHGHLSPVSPSLSQQQQSAPTVEPVPPPSKGATQSNRAGRYSGMFHQGYTQQYHGHLPGATLSRHLSIQLTPNQTLMPPLLPPPPPAVHAGGGGGGGGSHAHHSTVPMDGSPRGSSAGTSRDYAIPPPMAVTPPRALQSSTQQLQQNQSQSFQPQSQFQQMQQQQQQQQQSGSQPSVALPPPTVKYIRSPMRSPKMPQMSSQAMAHAQSQSQSQYRHHHSSYQQGPPPVQSNQHHLPPRTHRRSIQPLTLDQQQPKGGSFRYVRNQADLWPQQGSQKYRSIDAYGHSVSPLRALTLQLTKTYSHCNRDFKYEPSYNPRRVLTKPSKPMHNEGYDNEDYDYILYVSDILGSEERQRYVILDVLGQGTFGQVVKCQNLKTNAIVAVKVIKNKPAYFNQSMMEVTVLELLNERYDVDDRHHILRLQDTFIHRRHLCLVFELLSVNLYELIKQNQFRGLRMSLVRVFTAQLLDALCVLNEARIIHCDLKPENVLLKNLETPTIKVIDFGSACHEQQTVYTYIQSRFYRSPEVLVGLPYSSSIDIWSVGCIAAELFLGLPLFPGSSEYNQLSRIVEMLGILPTYMLEIGKTAHEFFERVRPEHLSHNYNAPTPKRYRLKSMETYSREHNVVEQPSKRYFQATTLPDIINSYPMMKKGMTQAEVEKEMMNRQSFINFLQGLLNLNPIERWSPHQAKLHPFITGEPFTGNFIPPTIPKKPATAENSARLEPTLPGKSTKIRSGSFSASVSTPTLSGSQGSGAGSSSWQQQQLGVASSALKFSKAESSESQAVASKTHKESTSVRAPASISATAGSMATSSDSSPGSSLTDVSSLNASPALPTAPLVDEDTAVLSMGSSTPSRGTLTFAPDTRTNGSPDLQTTAILPLSSSSHHHQRPRATTMGTVEVPKNMAQLAAAITPHQVHTPGGSSNLSHRTGPNDSSSSATTTSSSLYSSTSGHFGSGRISGLRQIPERSEQNSPAFDGSTSVGEPLVDGLQPPLHQQYQQHQQPHRYLLRSGSDSTGKGSPRLLRDADDVSESGNRTAAGQSTLLPQDAILSESASLGGSKSSSNAPELTPLQRMQQQLLVGQSQYHQQQQLQQQQQQQRHRFQFGYPQLSPSLSGETGSSSGMESNSSSRQDNLSEPDFDAEGGHSLQHLNLGSHRSRSSDSMESSEGRAEMEELDAEEYRHGEFENTSFSETRTGGRSGANSGSPYSFGQRCNSGLQHSLSDGTDSPEGESSLSFGAGRGHPLSSPLTVERPVGVDNQDAVLSKVEEEEEDEVDVNHSDDDSDEDKEGDSYRNIGATYVLEDEDEDGEDEDAGEEDKLADADKTKEVREVKEEAKSVSGRTLNQDEEDGHVVVDRRTETERSQTKGGADRKTIAA